MKAPARPEDRSLAIVDHALDRLRERCPAAMARGSEDLRGLISTAVRQGVEEPHWYEGQTRVRLAILGDEVWAVLGTDTTGWARAPDGGRGRAVVTFLSLEAIADGRAR